jgi:hypothetical protein
MQNLLKSTFFCYYYFYHFTTENNFHMSRKEVFKNELSACERAVYTCYWPVVWLEPSGRAKPTRERASALLCR